MLTDKQKLGELGEKIIENFLKQKKFIILGKNSRIGRSEFDLIAIRSGNQKKLYVFEVKTRTAVSYGFPEESVTQKKIDNLERCYYDLLKTYKAEIITYVIASVLIDKNSWTAKVSFVKVC